MVMNRKYLLLALVVGCLLSAFSCSQSKPTAGSNGGFGSSYDNSEYDLQTKILKVEGAGLSHDFHTARVSALTNVRKVVVDTLSALVNEIAARRGFDKSMPDEFYLSAIRRTSFDEKQTHNDAGDLLYRTSCEAEMLLLPMLQSIYQEKHFPADYGYYQFLRDIDFLLMSH